MARVNPDQFQEKHSRRTKAALDDMRAGVEQVTVAPGQQAAQKKEKMKARLIEAIDSGKWGRRVAAVPLEVWKDKMINKGIPRVSSGLDASKDKIRDFAAKLLPHVDRVVSEVNKMPDLTLEDSISRMTTFIRGMSKLKI